MTGTEGISLELDDIQSGALHERPSPYVGVYLLLRIDDRAAGRELVRRLHGLVDAGRPSTDPARGAWLTAAFTYQGLKALGVPQASLRGSGKAWPPAPRSWETMGRAARSTGRSRSGRQTSTSPWRPSPPTPRDCRPWPSRPAAPTRSLPASS